MRALARVALILGSLAAALLAVEFGFRFLYPDSGAAASIISRLQRKLRDGVHGAIQPYPYSAYRATPGDRINPQGFYDREHDLEKAPDVVRVVLLGGSTSASYAPHVEKLLNSYTVQRVEVVSFALASYSSAESLATFVLHGQHYTPDVVVIHHAVNDMAPRAAEGFRTDYSHWRRTFQPQVRGFRRWLATHSQSYVYWLWLGGLREFSYAVTEHRRRLHLTGDGRLRPSTTIGFEKNMRHLVAITRSIGARPFLMTMPHRTEKGGLFVQAIQEHNAILRRIAGETGVDLIDLFAKIQGHDEMFIDLVHFREDLQLGKALLVGEALWQAGVFDLNAIPRDR